MGIRSLAAVGFLLLTLDAMAQQPLRPPQIAPFGDSEWWILTASLPTRIGNSTEIITIPKGFVTDLTSIPRFFWSAFSKTGPYMSAAILHDYLYWDQRCTRAEADKIFDIEMKSYGVNDTSRKLIFSAVSEFGEAAWKSNTAAKQTGEPRFLPEVQLTQFLSQPFDASRTWNALRNTLPRETTQPLDAASESNPQLARTCALAVATNAER
jgi:hypothetical protein